MRGLDSIVGAQRELDFLRYVQFEQDPNKPRRNGARLTTRYVAFMAKGYEIKVVPAKDATVAKDVYLPTRKKGEVKKDDKK